MRDVKREGSTHDMPAARPGGLVQAAFWEASCSDRIPGYFSVSYSIGEPKGSMPCANTVFGNSPEPQIVNDPKSLYQSPSGAQGPVFTQSCNRRRSCWEI